MDDELDLLRDLAERLIALAERRRGGVAVKWRLEALQREIESEVNAEQLRIFERPRTLRKTA